MSMMKDLMVDIETLGSTKAISPVITQIGACYFEPLTGEIGPEFYENISIQDGIRAGLEVDGDAIEFWLRQSNRSFLDNPRPIVEVLNELRNFSFEAKRVWAHATFDFPVLVNAYKLLGLDKPFSFRYMRDIRTLVDLAGVEIPKVPESSKVHDALMDCHYQVEYYTKCLKELDTLKRMVWQ